MDTQQTNERLHNSLVSWANLKTDGAKIWMKNSLAKCEFDHQKNPNLASKKIRKFMKVCCDSDISGAINRFSELYNDIYTITNHSKNNLESEATGELIFLGELFQPFNFIPYLLTIWALLRVWIMPISSMIMPILVLILPYFFVRCVIGKSISVNTYLEILKSLAISTIPFGNDKTSQGGGSFMTLISLGFTVFQSVIQSYWSHKHLFSIDQLLIAKAEKIVEFLELYENIYEILKSRAGIEIFRPNWPVNKHSRRETLAVALLYPNILKIYVQCVVEVEVWITLAQKVLSGNACIVQWTNTGLPQFGLIGGYDPDVDNLRRVPVNILIRSGDGGSGGSCGENNHYLLTGPNRGGKSTALRAISASLYLSHTFGIALGSNCKSSIFKKFHICLTPDDLPGKKSRFEREIEFCKDILKPGNNPKIVLIDELFHSTNPPDAEFSSKVFTERLWRSKNILSIISTHLFEFVESAPSNIGKICCPAEKIITADGKTKLIFSYGLAEGICRVSSVESLLRIVRLIE